MWRIIIQNLRQIIWWFLFMVSFARAQPMLFAATAVTIPISRQLNHGYNAMENMIDIF